MESSRNGACNRTYGTASGKRFRLQCFPFLVLVKAKWHRPVTWSSVIDSSHYTHTVEAAWTRAALGRIKRGVLLEG